MSSICNALYARNRSRSWTKLHSVYAQKSDSIHPCSGPSSQFPSRIRLSIDRSIDHRFDQRFPVRSHTGLVRLERDQRVPKREPVRDQRRQVDLSPRDEVDRERVAPVAVPERTFHRDLLVEQRANRDLDAVVAHAHLNVRTSVAEQVQPCLDAHFGTCSVDHQVDARRSALAISEFRPNLFSLTERKKASAYKLRHTNRSKLLLTLRRE